MTTADRPVPIDNGHPEPAEPAGQDCARMFALLWEELSSVIGTPATASLLRRALASAAEKHPKLGSIVIARQGLTYSYEIPSEVTAATDDCLVPAFRGLFAEVLGLVGELTGGVMVRRLLRIDELSGWLPDTEVPKWQAPSK